MALRKKTRARTKATKQFVEMDCVGRREVAIVDDLEEPSGKFLVNNLSLLPSTDFWKAVLVCSPVRKVCVCHVRGDGQTRYVMKSILFSGLSLTFFSSSRHNQYPILMLRENTDVERLLRYFQP